MSATRWLIALIFLSFTVPAAAQPHSVTFQSSGIEIPAFLQKTTDAEPRALVVYLHGNPGGRIAATSPLANILAAKGIDTFWFNYRGLWGNGGAFSLASSRSDLRAAIDYLRNPATKARFRLGDAPIVLIGYSFGSSIALLEGADDDRIAGVVAYAPCDHGVFGGEIANPQSKNRDFLDEMLEDLFGPSGPIPGGRAAFVDDLVANQQAYRLPEHAVGLRNKALLLLVGRDDDVCWPENHFFPMYRTLRTAQHPRLEASILNAGHGLGEVGPTVRHEMAADWIARTFPRLDQ